MLLDGIPFEFNLAGNVSYVPTSGGIPIPGYMLNIGYTKHQWIGKFYVYNMKLKIKRHKIHVTYYTK